MIRGAGARFTRKFYGAAGTVGWILPGVSMCEHELACIPLIAVLTQNAGLYRWDSVSSRYAKPTVHYTLSSTHVILLKFTSYVGAFYSAVNHLPSEETPKDRAKKQVAALEALE